MLGEALLWLVVLGALVAYTVGLWIPAAVRERWKARWRRVTGRR